MNITLEYSQPDGQTRRVWLGKDQVLRFGRSSRADVVIDTDSKLADIHFAVTGLGHEWRVTSVGVENAIFVNGKSANYHSLEHGDTVHAGGTLFRVSIDGLPEPIVDIPDEPPKAPLPPAPMSLEFSLKHYPSKVVEFNLAVKDNQIATVLNALAKSELLAGHQVYCAVNAKRLGRRLATLEHSDSDLFSHAPEEIRETDSLEVLPVPLPLQADVLNEITLFGRGNASFLLLSPQPLDTFLESHKLVWGWYGRPKILYQQLTLGSTVLAEKLVVGSEIVLLFGPSLDSNIKLLTQKSHSDKLLSSLQTILI